MTPDAPMRSVPPDGVPVVQVATADTFAFEGEYAIGRAASILPAGDLMIVGDRLGDPRLVVYDIERRMPIQRLGREGNGPGEIGDPSSLDFVFGTTDSVQLYDNRLRRLLVYSLDESGLTYVRQEAIPTDVLAVDVLPLSNGFALTGLLPDAAVYVADQPDGSGPDAAGSAPRYRKLSRPTEQDNPTMMGMVGSRPFATSDPSGERVAIGFLDRNTLQFLHADGSSSVLVTDTVQLRTPPDSTDVATQVVGLAATDRLVFVLFCGCQNSLPREVLVYDWSGRLRGVMVLDREVYGIAVSRDGRRLFGGIEEPEPVVGLWNIPDEW